MRNQQAITATMGFLCLFSLTLFFPLSKTRVLSILPDAQAVQEVSPTVLFPKKSLNQGQLVNTQTEFGFKLFSTLTKVRGGENIFISPSSIALSVSLLYNGSRGNTQQEIASLLDVEGVDIDALNQSNQTLLKEINTNHNKVELVMANSVWAKQGFSFRYQFLKDNQKYYDTKITNLNFTSSESLGIINRWVQDKTQGKIQNIMNKLSHDDTLFLINAVSFQGDWQVNFDKNLTTDQPFNLSNGHQKIYPFMSRQGQYKYWENSVFQTVNIPYGDGRFSLYLFLPKPNKTIKDIIGQLTVNNWSKWLNKFSKKTGLVQIPRFHIEYEVDLKNTLKSLGVSTIFKQSDANFSALSSRPAYIDGIKHKTLLKMNETGTNSPSFNPLDLKLKPLFSAKNQFSMVLNRPFISAIRDNKTDTILLIGSIIEPQ
ncbi:serpin family protein [Aphanothece sacrum]|uniref:Proteinase inhibitor I4 serpin n=1 Tax=Aphanothece sacrum FPU1 TaxID=1920663 RepID=A0A401IJF2_APHSA|nr:serpin family protein [Aphanothece sacrum]GBF81389.1 proteinase inhibitor I4 serpin [Aphanothece sacrum FPU1]GBF85420.1 proteinase inhibitor I4 serpin [Aphanothece sacrum FPU3]